MVDFKTRVDFEPFVSVKPVCSKCLHHVYQYKDFSLKFMLSDISQFGHMLFICFKRKVQPQYA